MNGQQWNEDDFPIPCSCGHTPTYMEGSDSGIQAGFYKCKFCGQKGKTIAAFIGNPAVWDLPYKAAKEWNDMIRSAKQ